MATYTGSGTEGDPYLISDCAGLKQIDVNTSAHWGLANDIDCSGYNWGTGADGFDAGAVWDGNGYTISNLFINASEDTRHIFSHVRGSTFRNTKFYNITRVELDDSGGVGNGLIIGQIRDSGYIENIEAENMISDTLYKESTRASTGVAIVAGDYSGTAYLNNISVKNAYVSCSSMCAIITSAGYIANMNGISIENAVIDLSKGISNNFQRVGGITPQLGDKVLQNAVVNNMTFIYNLTGSTLKEMISPVAGDAYGGIIHNVYVINSALNCTDIAANWGRCGAITGRCGYGGTFLQTFYQNDTQPNDWDYGGEYCTDSDSLHGRTTSDLQTLSTYSDPTWDMDYTWILGGQFLYPALRWNSLIPDISITYPLNNMRNNVDTINMAFVATHPLGDDMSCMLYLRDLHTQTQNVTNGTAAQFEITFPEGTSEYYLRCTDQDGDFTKSKVLLYDFDNSTPFINSYSPSVFNDTVFTDVNHFDIIGNVTDNALYWVYLEITRPDGSQLWANHSGNITGGGTYTWDVDISVSGEPDGIYQIYIGATDALQVLDLPGLNHKEESFSFELDNRHPDWDCIRYSDCTELNLQFCDEVIDLNNCSEDYEGIYNEFTANVCVYQSGGSRGGSSFPSAAPGPTEVIMPASSKPLLFSIAEWQVEIPSWLQRFIDWINGLDWEEDWP